MRSRCVVELTFGTLSSGSGYLITPRHVLTARHVVEPCAKGSPCVIAPLGISGDAAPPRHEGKAAWLSKQEDQDLAIIEADGAGWPDLASERVLFGTLDADEQRAFQSVGFPEAAGSSDHPIDGTLKWATRQHVFNLEVARVLPRNPDWWAGFSGAMVFCGGFSVGVVRKVVGNFNGLLTATPLARLPDDPDFQRYWARQGLPLPERRPATRLNATLLDQIAARLFKMDRSDTSNTVVRSLAKLKDCVPQVIVVPGVDEDDHHLLIQQLSSRAEVQRFLEREAAVEDTILPLPWPVESPEIEPDAEFRKVVEALYKAARLEPPPDKGADIARLRASFDDGVTPRAFWVLGRQAIAFEGHGELLRRLLELWYSLPPGRPVVLFLCLALDQPPEEPPNLLEKFGFPRRKRTPGPGWPAAITAAATRPQVIGLASLSPIAQTHVDPWIELLRAECHADPPEQIDGLRVGLLSRVRQEKRLRQVAVDLDDLLARA